MQQFYWLQFAILTFIYSSTCFRHPHAHHRELNKCGSSLWFYLRIVVIAVLLFVIADHKQQHGYHHDTKVKPEATTTVVELPMMGVRTPETCWAVNKCQDNKLKSIKLLHLVGDLFELNHKAPSSRHYKNGLEKYHGETQTLWLDSLWFSINQCPYISHELHSVLQPTKTEDIQKQQ